MKLNKLTSFKKALVFVALVVVVPGLLLISAEKKAHNTPVVKKGATVITFQGHVRSLKDVNQTPLNQRIGPRKMRAVVNLKRDFPGKKSTTPTDTMVQVPIGEKETPKIVDPIDTIEGLNLSQHGSGWPPDTTGDVGVDYYIQAVNTSFAIFEKSTGTRVFWSTFDDFFEGPAVQGTPCDEQNQGDVMVLFDPYENRWIILDFAFYYPNPQGQGSWFSIAVSQTSDPTGNWYLYALQADTTLLNDYPKIGVWHDAIYITANMFTFPPHVFQGARVWALNKADLYSGTMNAQTLFDNSWEAWAILPANAKGPTPPASSLPHYMVAMDADDFGGPGQDRLVVWEYDLDWTTPGNTTWTGPFGIPTAPFDLNFYATVPQPGTSNRLDAIEGRLMFPAIYREFEDYASVYLCHTVESSNTRKTRWYEMRITDGTPSIYQQGTYAPDAEHRWMASTAGDEDGNIALGYSVSSTSTFPSIWYTGRASINPTLNVLQLGEAHMVDGRGSQTSYDRWGDYTTMTIDPVDDQTFWYTNEYFTSTGTLWRTKIGYFRLKPDLWSQDSPEDTGEEPNTTTTDFWLSEDMWVRNQADGFVNQVHQNPEYGQTNYVYVRIRCRDGEGSGRVKTYWSYAGTGMWWPDSWEPIGTQYTGTIQTGNEEILEFPWDPPDPSAYGPLPFCLWSRIETAPDSPYGMAFPEVPSFWDNVVNNNNIIWKNFTIVDNIPDGESGEQSIFVANPTKETVEIRLVFRSPAQAESAAKTALAQTTADKNVLQWGTVKVDLGNTLYNKWQSSNRIGTGVTVAADRARTIKVTGKDAHIEAITLRPGEKHLIKVIFSPFAKSVYDRNDYAFDVIQFHFNGKKFVQTGGVRFVVKPPVKAKK
ncbi:MAG: hypothetical protein PVH61_11090 [Candidatus Aminicenantes bacterium]|jgi:hypothetical protein